MLGILNWLTSINFDELIFKRFGPLIIICIFLIISFFLALKVSNDIKNRTSLRFIIYFSILIVFIFNIIGYIIYLIIRPSLKETYLENVEKKYIAKEVNNVGKCMFCNSFFFENDQYCFNCGNKVRDNCKNCNYLIDLSNSFCRNCGFKTIKDPISHQIKRIISVTQVVSIGKSLLIRIYKKTSVKTKKDKYPKIIEENLNQQNANLQIEKSKNKTNSKSRKRKRKLHKNLI